MTTLSFRLPGRADALGAWLARLLPEIDRVTRRRWFEEGRVRVDDVQVDRSAWPAPAGGRVEIELDAGERATLGAESDATARHTAWWAWVDQSPFAGGRIALEGSRALSFEVDAFESGCLRLSLRGDTCSAAEICTALASAGWPVLGDLHRGGLAMAGGPWVADAPDQVAPERLAKQLDPLREGPAWRGDAESDRALDGEGTDGEPLLVVSEETARVLAAGHQWIRPDSASDPATRFARGALVRIADRTRKPLGWARVEADPRLAARVWSSGAGDPPSVESRVATALARRRTLIAPADWEAPATEAFRLIHGEADGLPGLYVDRLGPLLRIFAASWASEGFRARVRSALQQQLPVTATGAPFSHLELLHHRVPGKPEFERVRWTVGGLETLEEQGVDVAGSGFFVHERGLRFFVDPGWHAPRAPRPGFGLFLDQRENRDRVAVRSEEGGRWLNLFAHTGAFSVALLAAGAASVTSVDLSAPYLARLEENLRANQDRGVDLARHETIRGDARRTLDRFAAGPRFDGIVIDPPTAAAAGRHFWSVKQDLEPLLRSAVDCLEPGGDLLVTQNQSGPPLGLDGILERMLDRAGRKIERLESAPAGFDHPRLAGFPEGDPFEGWWVKLRA